MTMASFSLKENYNPNSILTPNGSFYDSSVIPVCFQTLRYFEILKKNFTITSEGLRHGTGKTG